MTRQNAGLPAVSLCLVPSRYRSSPAVSFSGLGGVKSRSRWRGLRPIVFVLNNSGDLSERLLCKNPTIAYNDIAAWNYAELPHALGCQGWFSARVNTCGSSTTHSRQPSNPMTPPTSKSSPMPTKLHRSTRHCTRTSNRFTTSSRPTGAVGVANYESIHGRAPRNERVATRGYQDASTALICRQMCASDSFG